MCVNIKQVFRDEWPVVAHALRKWEHQLRAQSAEATRSLLTLADPKPGMRVLDLACGIGEPTLALARSVGPQGEVMASDLVAGAGEFVERAAADEGLTWIAFQTADMESLPFEAASFDIVTCRLGLMLCPDPARALAEARRVLKPGGRAAYVVWGDADQALFASTLGVLKNALLSEEPSVANDVNPFRFQQAGSLAEALRQAGFTCVVEESHSVPWPFAGAPEDMWEMFNDLAGPRLQRALAALSAEARAELDTEVAARLRCFERNGVVDTTASLVLGAGERASD
ncbi:MAG: class I SAM-dependent methyltransferase [Myxococcota bacterium]